MTKLDKTFTWETKNDLVVIVKSGNAPISVSGWDKEESILEMKLDIEEDVENLEVEEFCKAEYNEEKNQLDITLDIPSFKGTNKISMKLFVPTVTEVIATTMNGPVSIKGLQGIQTVESMNGPISLSEIEGDLEIKSKNGPLSLKMIKGNPNIDLINGPIKISECSGDLTIKQNNGSVKLIKCEGKLLAEGNNGSIKVLKSGFENSTLKTKNGQVYYEFLSDNKGNYNIETDLGRINLILPDDLEFDLEGRTKMGSFKVSIDGDYTQGTEDDIKIFEMVKGAGNATIKAVTNKGSVIISDKLNIKTDNGMNFDFDFDFDHIIDGVMDFIPEEKLEKITRSMDKLKEKLKNINFPDIEKKIEVSIKKAEDALQKELNKESNKEAFVKMKSNIHKAAEKVHDKIKSSHTHHHQQEDQTEKQQSRLKILELLENGKISAEQAEKLLKAVENK